MDNQAGKPIRSHSRGDGLSSPCDPAEKSTMGDEDLRTLSDLSIYNCIRFGPYKALIYEDQHDVREYSNMDLAREAAQLAEGLQALGIQKGDRVIVMMLNCPEVIIAY